LGLEILKGDQTTGCTPAATLATRAVSSDFEPHLIGIGAAAAICVGRLARARVHTISVIASDACIEWTIGAQLGMTLDTFVMIDTTAGTAECLSRFLYIDSRCPPA
jgi:hypothetical protein